MFGGEHRGQDRAFALLRRCRFEFRPLVEFRQHQLIGYVAGAHEKHDVVFRGEEIEQAGERTYQIRKRAPSVTEGQVDEEDCGGERPAGLQLP